MHTLKKNKSWIPLVCLVICGLAFSVKAGVTSAPKASFTGKQLFAGIFFGRGPVAEKLPAIRHILHVTDVHLSNSQELFIQKEEDNFMNLIELKCPGLLNRFESQIQSGDYLKVQKTLDETFNQIGQAIPHSPINTDNSKGTSSGTAVILPVDVTTTIDVEVNLILGNSAQNIYLNRSNSALKEETIVNEIVANL